MKPFIYLFAICLTILSCSSDDSSSNPADPDANSQDGVLLKRLIETYVDYPDTITYDYTYDGNKLMSVTDTDGYSYIFNYENELLTNAKEYLDNVLYTNYVLDYNQDSQLTSIISYHIEDHYLNTLGFSAQKEEYIYNTDGTIISKYYRGDHTSQTVLQDEQQIIFDDNGNIINYVDPISGEKLNEYENVYDTKHFPLKNIHQKEVFQFINADTEIDLGIYNGFTNNLTNTILTDEIGGPILEAETFEYTYNSLDYPITCKTYYYDDANPTPELDITIEYIYE